MQDQLLLGKQGQLFSYKRPVKDGSVWRVTLATRDNSTSYKQGQGVYMGKGWLALQVYATFNIF